jgi:cytochrome b561
MERDMPRRGTNNLVTGMGLSLLLLTLPAATVMAAVQSAPTPEGMLPFFESWIALTIVGTAAGTAWLLNHTAGNARALGTMFIALLCFGVVAWFVSILGSGIVDFPKPHQTPMDAAKPMLLWIQAGTALVAGLFLLVVANRQRINTQSLDLTRLNESSQYGSVSRFLHWMTAILFILMVPMGIFASMIPEDVWYRTEYNIVHKTIGFIVLGLFAFRLIWNFKSKRPSLESSLKPIERKLAHGAHIGLYLLLFLIPLTGYMMTSLHGYPSYFFFIEIPSVLPESDAYIIWGLFHKYILQYLIYIVLGAHVMGVLKHHFIDKHHNAIKRMVS